MGLLFIEVMPRDEKKYLSRHQISAMTMSHLDSTTARSNCYHKTTRTCCHTYGQWMENAEQIFYCNATIATKMDL